MTDVSKIDMERINGLLDKLEEVTNKLNLMKYVIETGQSEDGNQWYRKWSDGWIEQGGIMISNANLQTINLIIPFTTITYCININQYRPNASSAGWDYHYVIRTSVTKSSFQVNIADKDGISWYTCGY